jgi:hypothetical protein
MPMTAPIAVEKIPVIAKGTVEFINWLMKKGYSKKDYIHVQKVSEIRLIRSRVVVLLPGAMERSDWPTINSILLLEGPVLIAG